MKLRFRRPKKLVLALTSLLDMFTIILVFLIVNFEAEDREFVMQAGVELPNSSAKNQFKPGVNLGITRDAVFVEGASVFQLEPGGNVKPEDFRAGRIEKVVSAVERAKKNHTKEDEEDIALIQSDKSVPYRTFHLVMRSAAYAGIFRFRMAVVRD